MRERETTLTQAVCCLPSAWHAVLFKFFTLVSACVCCFCCLYCLYCVGLQLFNWHKNQSPLWTANVRKLLPIIAQQLSLFPFLLFPNFLEDCLIEDRRYLAVFSKDLHIIMWHCCRLARVRRLVQESTSSKNSLPNFFASMGVIRHSSAEAGETLTRTRLDSWGEEATNSEAFDWPTKMGGLLCWHLFSFSILILSSPVFFLPASYLFL